MQHTTVIIKNTSIKLYFTDRDQMFNIKSTATINYYSDRLPFVVTKYSRIYRNKSKAAMVDTLQKQSLSRKQSHYKMLIVKVCFLQVNSQLAKDQTQVSTPVASGLHVSEGTAEAVGWSRRTWNYESIPPHWSPAPTSASAWSWNANRSTLLEV